LGNILIATSRFSFVSRASLDLEHFRIQTRISVISEDFGPQLDNGIRCHFLQPGSLSPAINLCEHLGQARGFLAIRPFFPLGERIVGISYGFSPFMNF
jgi:hypothetical protein